MKNRTALTAVSLLLVGGSALGGITNSVTVNEVSYATVNDETEVDYSVVTFDVPELAADEVLSDAFLEFYLDVASTLNESLSDGVATVQIAIMPELVEGKLPVERRDMVVASRVVKLGTDRMVRVYITSIVREAMAQHEADVTLLVGSITGSRHGRFDAKVIPTVQGNAKATLTVQTRNKIDRDMLGID